jgi:hypothetical protein
MRIRRRMEVMVADIGGDLALVPGRASLLGGVTCTLCAAAVHTYIGCDLMYLYTSFGGVFLPRTLGLPNTV